jgi:NADH-quinone oxidoreductase subunit M
MIVIVGLGIYPKPLLDAINPAVQQTNTVVRSHDPVPSVPEESSPTRPLRVVEFHSSATVTSTGSDK